MKNTILFAGIPVLIVAGFFMTSQKKSNNCPMTPTCSTEQQCMAKSGHGPSACMQGEYKTECAANCEKKAECSANCMQSENKTECSASCMDAMASMSDMHVDTLRKDPVCGMKADDTKSDTAHYNNTVYAFCSKHCKESFVKDPAKYLDKPKTN